MKSLTLIGLRRVVNKAAKEAGKRYPRSDENGAGVKYMNDDGSFRVFTVAGNGDNVSWATSIYNSVDAELVRRGYECDNHTFSHHCGNCEATFKPKD